MAEIFPEPPLTSLPAAVAAMGALPVPVGPQQQALNAERLAEIRSLLRYESSISFHSARAKESMLLLLAEVEQWRATYGRDALPGALARLERAEARVAELESDLATANGVLDDTATAWRADAQQALPWAHVMPDGDLHGFLDDMVSAALGRWRSGPEVPDRTVLADIERVCREWRTPGEGYRSDSDEGTASAPSVPSGETDPGRRAAWRMLSREEPHDSPLHQAYRVGHDLPELGGAQ